MTSGGRLILTNTSLSSIPIYTMGMYRLPESIHYQMDSIRGKFFWQGASEKFKYHMIKWRNLCIPKDYGGVGIIIMDTRYMNEALLGKWGWRILTADGNDICINLLSKSTWEERFFCRQIGVGVVPNSRKGS